MNVLNGVRIVEFEGLGPGPFCGMLLADLGANVILVERKGGAAAGPAAIHRRGKRSIALDLKNDADRAIALRIIARADALIEGLRPGVMERLGLGPDAARAVNPKLVYGRLTGWGQDGPLAQAAGHDINYAGLSGAAWYSGAAGAAPLPPPTLVGDIGGGALYLAVGILAGIVRARETGAGAVVDAAIVDGSAHMMTLLYAVRAAGLMGDARGASMLDGAPFYTMYECACGGLVSVGPLEPKFFAELMERIGLAGDADAGAQYDAARWPALREKIAARFRSRPRAAWMALLEGTDACVAPVLSPSEAAAHPHMRARGVLVDEDGVLQARAAPRFDGAPPPAPNPVPRAGQHTEEILREIGAPAS